MAHDRACVAIVGDYEKVHSSFCESEDLPQEPFVRVPQETDARKNKKQNKEKKKDEKQEKFLGFTDSSFGADRGFGTYGGFLWDAERNGG